MKTLFVSKISHLSNPTPGPERAVASLTIKQSDEGFFLFRHGQGTYLGDTLHDSVEEAKEQAKFEFGERVIGWMTAATDNPQAS